MTRKAEGKAQDRLLEVFRGQGLLVQKFTDLMTSGVTDVLVGLPVPPPPGMPKAMWLELKAVAPEDMPKRATSPFPAAARPRPEQMAWMREWNALHPAGMVLFAPKGWVAVPVGRIEAFFDIPHTAVRLSTERPTYGRIVRSLESWNCG